MNGSEGANPLEGSVGDLTMVSDTPEVEPALRRGETQTRGNLRPRWSLAGTRW
jgi:hypothetical protein